MAQSIRIIAGEVEGTGTLNDSETADRIWEVLPISAEARTWGDEVYFPIPVDAAAQDAHEDVPSGTLAYWPPGKCFCIFFGQRPASPVNVVGELDGDAQQWSAVREGAAIRIERA
jgi:hypothetical protein